MAEIQSWEPMKVFGRPLPDAQTAILDDPRGAGVVVHQNGGGAFHAIITIHTPEHEADVIVTWPNAEPDHGIPEETVKAWAARWLPELVKMFGAPDA